jgi:glyoxylase-like metal-dependent hydrolase (beta-lactamase superfamily II)
MPTSTIVVGKTQIIALLDTYMQFPWSVFLPDVARSEIDAYKDLYPGSFGEPDAMFRTCASAYVIRSEGKTIVCDTGVGPGPHAWLGGLTGNLLADMESTGVSADEVDTVVHTHLHGDHVGWNLAADGKPTFPRARYLAPQADWDLFRRTAVQPADAARGASRADGLLELVSGEKTITSEVTTYPTPGHTPGHQSIMVTSARERAIVTGDLAHFPAQVDRIEWCPSFDLDKTTNTETRRKLFQQLEADGVITAFCHFAEAPFGRLIRSEGKRIWQAIG